MKTIFTKSFFTNALLLATGVAFSQPVPFLGNGTQGYSGDGGPALNAQLQYISSFCGDAAGNIYISDYGNNDVRKVNSAGIISTIAGNQTAGFSGDGGQATLAAININSNFGFTFIRSADICKDAAGNLYINDFQNRKIRKVSPLGIITTVGGTGLSGYTGDGGLATAAKINCCFMTVDNTGNIFFSDSLNHVRKINTAGIITTFAGTGVMGYSGDGGPANLATLNHPVNLVTDATGNLYVSDYGNSVIRKITPAGIITTYAGNGTSGYTGDGGMASLAKVTPGALAMNPNNEVCFVSYTSNNFFTAKANIRKVNNAGIISTVKDSTNYNMGGQYVAYMNSIYIDATNSLYFSPDFNVCVGFCDPGRCYKSSLNSSASGIEAIDYNNTLASVYPNTNNGVFTINTTLLDNTSYQIIDMQGKIIHTGRITDKNTQVNLENVASGNYNLIINANGVSVKKNLVIIQ